MKKKLFSVAALAMAFAMAVTGCSSSEGETAEGETAEEETAEEGYRTKCVGKNRYKR